MDELNTQPQHAEQSKPQNTPKKKMTMNMWWILILGILFLASLGFLGWYWWQTQAQLKSLGDEKAQLQTQIDTLKKAQADANAALSSGASPKVATPCNSTPTAALKENIKASLDSQNTAAIGSYASNPVKFVIAASEKGGNETPDQAAADMDYTHTATGPWDFALPAATTNTWKAGFYKDYFGANTYVGKAASGMVASFDFDCNGKIKTIFLAADASLL